MKEKEIKTLKKLSLDKFKVAELKNPRVIIGGKVPDIRTSPGANKPG
jgi:hypothetical protein